MTRKRNPQRSKQFSYYLTLPFYAMYILCTSLDTSITEHISTM